MPVVSASGSSTSSVGSSLRSGGSSSGGCTAGLCCDGGGVSSSVVSASCGGAGSNASQPSPFTRTSGHTAASADRSFNGDVELGRGGTRKPVATRASTPSDLANSANAVANCSLVPRCDSFTKIWISASCCPPSDAFVEDPVLAHLASIARSCSMIVASAPASSPSASAWSVKVLAISSTWSHRDAGSDRGGVGRCHLGGHPRRHARLGCLDQSHHGALLVGLDHLVVAAVELERPAGERDRDWCRRCGSSGRR